MNRMLSILLTAGLTGLLSVAAHGQLTLRNPSAESEDKRASGTWHSKDVVRLKDAAAARPTSSGKPQRFKCANEKTTKRGRTAATNSRVDDVRLP